MKASYLTVPQIQKEIPRMFFGTSTKKFLQGDEDCSVLLDGLYGIGVTAFDTARVYRKAEETLGKWLSKQDREKLVILSKGGHPYAVGIKRIDARNIKKDLERSLRALQTSYIDIYLLHRDDEKKDVGEIVELLNGFYAEGKIKAFGGSNWRYERIEEANEYAYKKGLQPFTFSSPYYGLGDMVSFPWRNGCVSLAGEKNRAEQEKYRASQLPVVAYSCLGHGLFSGRVKSADFRLKGWANRAFSSRENEERLRRCEEIAASKGKSVAQIALAWLLCDELNTIAVVSASSVKRMKENLEALQIDLTKEERGYLDLRRDAV